MSSVRLNFSKLIYLKSNYTIDFSDAADIEQPSPVQTTTEQYSHKNGFANFLSKNKMIYFCLFFCLTTNNKTVIIQFLSMNDRIALLDHVRPKTISIRNVKTHTSDSDAIKIS